MTMGNKYTEEQWNEISKFPIEFFQMFNSLYEKRNKKTTRDMDAIINKKQHVKVPFDEEALYELFHGDISGLIICYVMKNQDLFINNG
jgi:hypothetical protein